MKKELKKITLIIDEIVALLLLHGASDINIQIDKTESYTKIKFVQKDFAFDQDFVDRLRFDLAHQRENEVEGYYWQLVGKDDLSDEVYLVGAMIDESQVKVEENHLTIEIKRIIKDVK